MARDSGLPQSKRDKVHQKTLKKAKKPLAVGRVLIVCEGEKTEPNYFKWWAKQLEKIKKVANSKTVGKIEVFGDEIEVKGEGKNTKSLVKKAIELKNQAKIDYKQIWCVFDRDSFPAQNYNTAIAQAHKNDFKVASSNEAFELWYLLHFNPIETAYQREWYKNELTKCLGKEYKKNDPEMYEKLLEHSEADQQKAIKHAKELLKELWNTRTDYAKHNPSTTVFELVESLNEHVWLFRCEVAPNYPLPYLHDCQKEECKKTTPLAPPYLCTLS